MLCPKLATQLRFIGESTKGLAFAFQDYGEEYKNIGANAKPLRVCFYLEASNKSLHQQYFIFWRSR